MVISRLRQIAKDSLTAKNPLSRQKKESLITFVHLTACTVDVSCRSILGCSVSFCWYCSYNDSSYSSITDKSWSSSLSLSSINDLIIILLSNLLPTKPCSLFGHIICLVVVFLCIVGRVTGKNYLWFWHMNAFFACYLIILVSNFITRFLVTGWQIKICNAFWVIHSFITGW